MMEWVKLLLPPFFDLIGRLVDAGDDDERVEATLRFQREASDAIMLRSLGIPAPPETKPEVDR